MITALTPPERLAPMLADVAEQVVVCGHTHHQFTLALDGRRVLNAGSVGMPYQGAAAGSGSCSAPRPSRGAPTTTSRERSRPCARPVRPTSTRSCCARASWTR